MADFVSEIPRDPDTDDQVDRYRFMECRCNAVAYGGCRCDDDGFVTHGGCERERLDHEGGLGGRQSTSRVAESALEDDVGKRVEA